MIDEESSRLRELIRILVRTLGILEKNDVSCSAITIAQCHAIVEIGRIQRLSLIELAELLGLDKSTMSRTIKNLVDAGLVNRETDPENRRYISIQLTDKGSEVFKSIDDRMNEYYGSIFKSIPEDKRTQVLESLELLISSIKDK